MRGILQLIRRLSSIGVTPEMPFGEERSIRFTNIVVLVLFFIFIYYVTFGFLLRDIIFTAVSIAVLIADLSVLFFNSRKMYRTARFILTFFAAGYVMFSSAYSVTRQYSTVYFLCCIVAVFLLYPPSAKKWLAVVLVVLTVGYIGMVFLPHRFVEGVALSKSVTDYVKYSAIFGALVCFIGLGWAYWYSIATAEGEVQRENRKVVALIENILPVYIIERLKENPRAISERFDDVTLIFADIVGFTPLSNKMAPADVIILLDRIFTVFDKLAEMHGVEKIKTVGDAYMAASLPGHNIGHTVAAAEMALDMTRAISGILTPHGDTVRLRIGISTGPANAGVIGKKKFSYDIWGATVTKAKMLEVSCPDGGICVSDLVYQKLSEKFVLEPFGDLGAQGESFRTWLLKDRRVTSGI